MDKHPGNPSRERHVRFMLRPLIYKQPYRPSPTPVPHISTLMLYVATFFFSPSNYYAKVTTGEYTCHFLTPESYHLIYHTHNRLLLWDFVLYLPYNQATRLTMLLLIVSCTGCSSFVSGNTDGGRLHDSDCGSPCTVWAKTAESGREVGLTSPCPFRS